MAQTKARQALDRLRKVVNTKIYIQRVVYTAQKKARQVLDKSRKFVKITRRVVYMAKTKAIQALGKSNNPDHLDNSSKE